MSSPPDATVPVRQRGRPTSLACVTCASSARGQFAAPARRPPRRGEAQARQLGARLQFLERALVRRALDAPFTVLLDVLVLVERRAANRDLPLRLDDGVLERPDAGRG